MPDGLDGVGLGVADEADRAALDPSGGVDAGDVAAVVGKHATIGVANNAVLRVEGYLSHR